MPGPPPPAAPPRPRPFGARDRPREDRLERPRDRLGERHRAAARAGHEQAPLEARAAEAVGQRAQVDGHARTHVGVDHGRRRALVLAVLARDLVRERDLALEAGLAQRRRGGELVLAVGVGVHEGDRHRGDALLREDLRRRAHVVELDRRADRAARHQALGHRQPQPARDQRGRRRVEQVVHLRTVAALDLDHVAEAARGEQPDDRPAPLQQRVQADGGAVQEVVRPPQVLVRDGDADRLEDPALGLGRGRRGLRDPDAARGLVEEDQVGERATDVDTDTAAHDALRASVRKSASWEYT
jgi:hypothetical protein